MQKAKKEEAKELNEKAAKEEAFKKRMQYINAFDGLLHMPDGTIEFPEGGVVGGVNALVQKHHQNKKHHHHKHHHKKVDTNEETLQEKE